MEESDDLLVVSNLKRRYSTTGMWKPCVCELHKKELIIKKNTGNSIEKQIPLSALTETIYEHKDNCRRLSIHNEDDSSVYLMTDTTNTFEEWKLLLKQATFHNSAMSLNDFNILTRLGKGYYGTVFLVEHKATGGIYALKEMKKKFLVDEERANSAQIERDVMIRSHHPFIVSMHFAFQSKSKVFIGMEYLTGGQLFRLVQAKYNINVQQLMFYIAEIALALDYLHSIGVVYRDLKLENVLICNDGHIKLTDFGLSKRIVDTEGNMHRTDSFCGTDEYLAPELIKGNKYDFSIDWWALGILMYELCFHVTPFYDKKVSKIHKNILHNDPAFPNGTPEAPKDLIKKLLVKNPKKRANFKTIVGHPLFAGVNWDNVYKKLYIPPFKPGDIQITKHKMIEDYDAPVSMTFEGEEFDNFSFCGEEFL